MNSSFSFGTPEGAKGEPFGVSKEATSSTQAAFFPSSPFTQASCSGFSFGETAQRTFGTARSLNNTVTTKCSYCNITLGTQEDIQCHLRRCEDLPINCPKCSDDVALKNWFDHKCQMKDEDGRELLEESSNVLCENRVIHDMREFFLKNILTDVVIQVKNQQFHAHRSILAARSPVFESTFRNDMKEKETGTVNIEDCDPSSFSDFLCFVYCGDAGVISVENVFSLFTTADKYDVQDLREKCVEFMKENLSVDTFCDTLILALQHSETELIAITKDFFVKNALEIAKTLKWQSYSADNPTTSNELFIKALEAAKNLK